VYVDTKRHDFAVRLQCESGEVICAADGDVITTVVALRSPQNSRLQSEVRFQTTVEALASCERSKAVLMQSDGPSKNASRVSASLRADAAHVFVELLVFDADGLPIRVSRPLSDAVWNSSRGSTSIGPPTKPLEDGGGNNRFVASIEPSLRNTRGSHTLRIGLTDAWNEALGTRGQCVLLEQTVNIEADGKAPTQYIIGGAVSGVVLTLLLLLLAYQIRVHKETAKRFFSSFIKYEGVLALKVCWDLWV
jgi:hypothetical protein